MGDEVMSIERQRERLIARARMNSKITLGWWDRDCRCCLELPWSGPISRNSFAVRTGIVVYRIQGSTEVIIVEGEEIHAAHDDDEVNYFIEASRARSM
jgi:hypothetical protein